MGHGAGRVRVDWLCELNACWQVTLGLDVRPSRRALARLLRTFGRLTPPESPLEALLLRGCSLEILLKLQYARGSVPARALGAFDALAHALGTRTAGLAGQQATARDLLHHLEEMTVPQGETLLDCIRHLLQQEHTRRLSAADVARQLGTNVGYVRAVLRSAGEPSIARHERERQLRAGVRAIRQGQPVKAAALAAGCSEATLRRLVRRATGVPPSRARHAPLRSGQDGE
jgi:AraC-like DNA-binding protein